MIKEMRNAEVRAIKRKIATLNNELNKKK